MFPIIPLLAIIAIVGGGTTLAWYSKLTREQQAEADLIAGRYAWETFGKGLKELTKAEANRVAALTKRHFVN